MEYYKMLCGKWAAKADLYSLQTKTALLYAFLIFRRNQKVIIAQAYLYINQFLLQHFEHG